MLLHEHLNDVLPEDVRHTSILIFSPPLHILVRIRPQQVTQQTYPIINESWCLSQELQWGAWSSGSGPYSSARETSHHACTGFVHQLSQPPVGNWSNHWKSSKVLLSNGVYLHAHKSHKITFIIKSVCFVHLSTFVIPSQKKEILWILHLVSK